MMRVNDNGMAGCRASIVLYFMFCFLGACLTGVESNPGLCGNGVVDDGETCDGNCPTKCSDGNPCTEDLLTGSADKCDVECLFPQILSCRSGDGCCPQGCDHGIDDDCPDCPAAKDCTGLECGPDPICGLDCGPCNNPPADICKDGEVLTSYPATGTCAVGTCDYRASEEVCPRGCEAGACMQCEAKVWEGNYVIGDAADMAALAGYTEVSGNLTIRITLSGIEDLSDMDCLERVGADLIIADNQDLVRLSTLESLFSIGGSLKIYGNPALDTLDGLVGLQLVEGSVLIGVFEPTPAGNANLKSTGGLRNLRSIAGDLEINFNDTLTNLDGFTNMTSIGSNLMVSFNPVLDNLDGLESLHDIGSDVRIFNNDSLVSLDGLSGLTEVPGDLVLGNLAALESLSGLHNIVSTHDVWFENMAGLMSLPGLDNLTIIHGSLALTDNPRLFTIMGLGKLNTIEGSLQMVSNPKLFSPGFLSLESVGNHLEIRDNASMLNLDGLNRVTSIGSIVPGFSCKLLIAENPSLSNLDGLSGLEFLARDMEITDNTALPTCEAENLRDRLRSLGWTWDAIIEGNDDNGSCD